MERKKPKLKTKTPAARTPHPMQESLHQQIAKRAYEIYKRRIRQGALDDWLEAEREILQEKPHRGGHAGAEQE